MTSDAGGDDTYALGERVRVTLTFSEAVDVDTSDGTPSLTIDMDPAYWGAKWAAYESGSGTTELVFAHTVVEPNYSTRGIAVLADTLRLNGGSIRSAASETDADLAHDGLAHDPEHRVDWRLPATQSTPGVNQAPVFVGQPPGRVTAPPTTLVSLPASQADFRDPDGDPLTFTLSASRDGLNVPGYPAYSEATGRIFFMANTECALAALEPPLPETFDTIVTMTATDPDGASAQATATFRTGRADFVCPSLSAATADGASVTLAFDADLGYSYAQPAASEFVVQAERRRARRRRGAGERRHDQPDPGLAGTGRPGGHRQLRSGRHPGRGRLHRPDRGQRDANTVGDRGGGRPRTRGTTTHTPWAT